MLKRIIIENYRSCVRTTMDLQPDLSVLIGPNGSGKTTILQSIMLLNRMVSQSDRLPMPPESGTSRLKALFQTETFRANVRTSFDPSANEMRLGGQSWTLVNADGGKFALGFPLSWPRIVGSRWSEYYSRDVRARRRQNEQLSLFEEVPGWANEVMSTIASFCGGIKYYSAAQFTNPDLAPVSFQVSEEGNRSRVVTSHSHGGLLYRMYIAKESDNAAYKRFLDLVGPQGMGLISGLTFKKVQTSSTTYNVRVGGKVESRRRKRLLVIPQFKIGKAVLSPNQLSEGTFKTLALVFHVMTDDSYAVLIEEPEVCVHQGLLSGILELIKSYSSQKQIVISTHSDYVLDHVRPENVYTVSLDKAKGTLVRHIPKAMTQRELAALKKYLATQGNLGEYWREGGLRGIS